jgi:tetratricopeptide (TPR) repeat protein
LLAARAAEARATPSGFATALADIDRALALSPRDPVALAERARVQVEQARFTGDRGQALRARATLERLVGRDPYNAEAWLRLGIAAALLGDDAGAERAWKRAERLAPRSAAAPADLALAYARQERWPEAATEARRALARDPGNQQARDVLRQNPGTKGGP